MVSFLQAIVNQISEPSFYKFCFAMLVILQSTNILVRAVRAVRVAGDLVYDYFINGGRGLDQDNNLDRLDDDQLFQAFLENGRDLHGDEVYDQAGQNDRSMLVIIRDMLSALLRL